MGLPYREVDVMAQFRLGAKSLLAGKSVQERGGEVLGFIRAGVSTCKSPETPPCSTLLNVFLPLLKTGVGIAETVLDVFQDGEFLGPVCGLQMFSAPVVSRNLPSNMLLGAGYSINQVASWQDLTEHLESSSP